MGKKIFVTGGAGYVGSHTCVELLRSNHDVIVYDDLSNSSKEAIRRVELLSNRKVPLIIGDIRNAELLNKTISEFQPDCVMHFAGLKAVGQSVSDPINYYDVNVTGSINLLKAMKKFGCNEIVFSSSATVYGELNEPPFTESMSVAPSSPYGRTKLIFENILQDWVNSNDAHRSVILRYFNPVGAHASGLIGEDPKDIPNNLMPLIVQSAQKKCNFLSIYGSNYDTRDGTGERDYIHVSDLAHGHVRALESIKKLQRLQILNLGSGKSTTVRELIDAFERSNNVDVPCRIVERRPGDVAKSFADPTLAKRLIDFECNMTLEEMCTDTWNWVKKNPNGYMNC
nr:UDP-glucose 4-epimerase [Paracoccaceae bacterium]